MRSLAFVLVCICVKELLADKSCDSFESCGACINFGGDMCVWCLEHNITASRCQSESFFLRNGRWCKNKFVYNPKMETLQYTKNDPLRAQGKLKAVQFRPQEITVKVRPGQPVDFSMFYQPAKDFPLDVYYLMDTSYTMNKLVEYLKNQVRYIYRELSTFTNNVQFGLGSFVEKPDFPYVDEPQRAYSFRHHLSLTQNVSLFDTVLSETRNYSNYDLPEAGLDALMQVMACDKVGWRPEVRRIIVLCTDATYHSAGDGKMVLAYKPNDMKCHLNSTMFYDYSLIQDYPSVSQINKMATDGNFKIIFAVSHVVKETYAILAKEILGARRSILNMNSKSEILHIIKSAYLQSLGSVTMKYQWPPHVQLTLTPDCTKDAYCKVVHKQAVEMKATLKVNYCPEDTSQHRQVLEVGPIDAGLGDKLKINLQIVCQCECEKDNSGIKNSTRCHSFGTYQCGICKCNKDRYGDNCQCDGTDTSKTDLDKCKKDKNDTSFCSGRGNCMCGKCTCNTGFSGDFCEYDDSACKRHDDKLCSNNGRCTHGACECDSADWSGDDCSCSMHNHNCLAPYSEEICSGNGDCVCNECVCWLLRGKEERYSGVFCEDCEECAERRCKELEGYVKCNFMFNKTHCDEQYNQTSNTEVQMLNKNEMNASKWPIAKWCQAKLDEDRSIVFIHLYDKYYKKLLLKIRNEEEVTPKANIWVPVGIAIASVVLIGLLTVLVWKLLVDAMDEREYNKFMKESQSDGYDVSENPFYQPASVNFANPAYIADNKLVVKHDH